MNYKLKGIVKFCGKEDKLTTLTIKLTDEQAERYIDALELSPEKYEGIPIKQDEETGNYYMKLKSIFKVKIYDKGELLEDFDLNLIGEDSEIEIFFGIAVRDFQLNPRSAKKTYQVADLKSINILKLEQASHFNPFDTDAVNDKDLTVLD